MSEPVKSDPRVYFAAERTFLAWVRSGIALMALGFVIAKFGLFLNLISNNADQQVSTMSLVELINTYGTNYLGVLILLTGVVVIIVAQMNHQHFIKGLPAKDVPMIPVRWLSALLTYSMAIAGLLISVYLLII